jgi:argininosuccinate lyase
VASWPRPTWLVLECERSGTRLQDLTVSELRVASPAFGEDALDWVDIDAVVARRTSEGGTALGAVAAQLAAAASAFEADAAWARAASGV